MSHKLIEREIDFVVVNRKKGVLCIEAKNGNDIRYYDRAWHYTSGKIMQHDGPYNQAASAKRALRNKMKYHENETVQDICKRCRMYHAAWFFDMERADFEQKNKREGLPEDAPIELTMFVEDVSNPTQAIERIFDIDITIPLHRDDEIVVKTDMSEEDFQLLLDSVFCPEFNLIPSPRAKSILMEEQMTQLLYEQYRLWDFLEDQDTAIINGAAGTGKTMIAVEKARRNSVDGERVLFLCYNRLLCEYLNEVYKNSKDKAFRKQFKNVDFLTIHKLTQNITGNYKDIDGLLEWLLECIDDPTQLEYKHIIVDEGQDFGLIDNDADNNDADTNCSIIDTLQEAVLAAEGTFYLFYDKYQMIQGGGKVKYKLLPCIEHSDCRLSLHYNCRNTKEIASTSVTPLRDHKNRAIKPKTACAWFTPATPIMHVVGSDKKAVQALDRVLEQHYEKHVEDVIILVQGKAEFSIIADQLEPGTGKNVGYDIYTHDGIEYRVSTCIKFKGLEADAIVMIGLDKDSFVGNKGLEFYVGTSRAKHYLDFVTKVIPEEYADIITSLAPDAPVKKNKPEFMRGILAEVFSAEVMAE